MVIMLQSKDNTQKNFQCSQCHQDMSNMDMLQKHIQTVHPKPPAKGLFSFVKQKVRGSQDTIKTSPELPSKPYSQYFSSNASNQQQSMGYALTYNDYFQTVRKDKHNQISVTTKQMLLRVELLTNPSEHIPSNGNSKERQKYEQSIVTWMEDSISSICGSCSKSFGLFGRKHHCRLDGRIICNQCSRFLSFSLAHWLIELNSSLFSTVNGDTLQRLNTLTNVILLVINNDNSNDEHLRICLSCGKFLQKFYNKIRFIHLDKDQLVQQYENIVQFQRECQHKHPNYTTMINSLLNGDTQYQISDAQHLYLQLNTNFNKIDSTSRFIAKLPESSQDDDRRYIALCRNIRTYSLQLIQEYSIKTKRVPNKDEIKRIQDERNKNSAEKLESSSSFQGIQFVAGGGGDSVVFF